MTDPKHHNAPWTIQTTQESFEGDVFERSHNVPVVVDFWAAWCAPCRMLAPLLEELADAYEGRFILVKANTEEVPQAAMQFGVQAIPAVFAVYDRQIVDSFQGLLPAEQLRQWLDRLLRLAALKEAEKLEQQDAAAAVQRYQAILQQSPNESAAQVGLARALLEQGEVEQCRQLMAQMEERGFLEPEAETIKARLELGSKRGVDIKACRARVAEKPEDLQRQFELAEALAGHQQYEEALEIALNLVDQDRHGVGEQARQLMVEIFHILPSDSELVSTYRRKLSLVLY